MQRINFDLAKLNAPNPQATTPLQPLTPAVRPQLVNKLADYELPAKLFCNWKEDKKPRHIVRAMTEDERGALQQRATELESGLRPFGREQRDDVRSALHAMIGGRRAFLRESGEGAEAEVDVMLYILRDFPTWAIEEACLRIAQGRAGLELHPRAIPSDQQVFETVAGIVAPYGKMKQQALSLLAAPVEPPAPPRPSKAEIEAKLGRPVKDGSRLHPIGEPAPDLPPPDGKHAQRVMADLEDRQRRREAQQGEASP